jgi:lipopolysaccharide transport protein LptA
MERATLTTRTRSRQSRGILLGALSAIAVILVAAAQIPSVTRPMQVRAETTSLDTSAQLVVFTGNVHMKIPACRLSSDRLRLNYARDLRDVKAASADGDVRIDRGSRWYTGNDALLDTVSRTIVLTGSPTIHEVGDETKARKITIHLDTDRNIIE